MTSKDRSSLGRYVRGGLGSILIAAAGLKSYQLQEAHPEFFFSGLLRHKAFFGASIQAELILAGWLLVGGFARLQFVSASVCFAIFAVISSYEAVHAIPSCGCFGDVKIPPMATAGFDVLAVLLLYFTRPHNNNLGQHPPSRRRVIVVSSIIAMISVFVWSAFFPKLSPAVAAQASDQSSGIMILEPDRWLSKPFPLLNEIDGSGALTQGRWLLVLYHYDCDSCREAIPLYQGLAADSKEMIGRPRVAFIAIPPIAPMGLDPVSNSHTYLHLHLRPDHDWFATTPIVVGVQDGNVKFVSEGMNAVRPAEALASFERQ